MCFCVYYYGGEWEQEITVLIAPPLTERMKRRLLEGERAIPWEHSGSIPGTLKRNLNDSSWPVGAPNCRRHSYAG